MNIFEFFNITVLSQNIETALSDFPSAAQEVIINSVTYEINT